MLIEGLKRGLITALCVASVSGCATFQPMGDAIDELFSDGDNAEPPAELTDYQAEIKLDIIWDESDGLGTDELNLNLVPAVNETQVIIADHDGLIQARNRLDGELLWEVETDLAISSGPVIAGEMLLVGTSKAEVLALNAKTGAAIWKQTVSSEVLALPLVVDNSVVIRSVDGQVSSLNKADGKLLWTVGHHTPALSIRGNGSPVVKDDVMIIAYADGKLAALKTVDGGYLWESSVAVPHGRSEVERLTDLNGTPILKDNTVFIGSYNSGINAASALDGDILWRNEAISSLYGLTADERYLYLSDASSDMWQLDQRNGASYWKQTDLHQRQLSQPAIYGDYVVVGDFEGYLHWLSKTDGRLLARIEITDEPIIAQPVIIDNIVYVYATDGELAAVKALLF